MPEASSIASEVCDSADRGDNALSKGSMQGPPAALTCPECGGAVWESNQEGLMYFRCHVGHAYTADSMATEHQAHLEATLWEALRMFEENAALHRRMAHKAEQTQMDGLAKRYHERMRESEARAEVIRKVLLGEGMLAREAVTSEI